jgi:hypothetical protein
VFDPNQRLQLPQAGHRVSEANENFLEADRSDLDGYYHSYGKELKVRNDTSQNCPNVRNHSSRKWFEGGRSAWKADDDWKAFSIV